MIKKIWHRIINLVYPPFCSFCLTYLDENRPLCDACIARIQPIASISLPLGSRYTMTVHAAGAYDDPLRPLIMAKLHRQRIAARHMAHILWELALKHKMPMYKDAVLTVVPLHWTRYAWRGYNQAEVIAQELSRLSGLRLVPALKRVRATGSQTQVSGSDRTENVRDAFVLNRNVADISGKRILLIDDLMTTGATLIEAGTVLKELKPLTIDALVVARTLKI